MKSNNSMISVQEATEIISSNTLDCGEETVDLFHAGGKILCSDIFADSDLPPFDRVMMDGIAVHINALESGVRSFKIAGIQRAGIPQLQLHDSGACLEVMTGAVCPSGANVVIPYEKLAIDNDMAHVEEQAFTSGMNIHQQGADFRHGTVLVSAGSIIGIPEIGIAASCGHTKLRVKRTPRLMLISTGDELVDPGETPASHQIRASGVYVIREMLRKKNFDASMMHINDDENLLLPTLQQFLNDYEVIVLTGGVSKGKFDLIPSALETLGVKKLFHRIAQKPGKPMWFGRSEKTVVFALPGNPVSSMMCATRYLMPWLQMNIGLGNQPATCNLTGQIKMKGELTQFLPIRITTAPNGMRKAHILSNHGSGDFAGISGAHGFIELSAEKQAHSDGDEVPVYLF
jgi:molybdopterin molybdotransferase